MRWWWPFRRPQPSLQYIPPDDGYDMGMHNRDLPAQQVRLLKGETYRDLSTLHITVSRGLFPAEVVRAREALMPEMNQRRGALIVTGHSCQAGYNAAVKAMLDQEREMQRAAMERGTPFKPWRYVFFTEDDVVYPGTALRTLYRAMAEHPEYHGISGLCWTRTPDGRPMILGDPNHPHAEFWPQVPLDSGVQPARAIPLGCTLMQASIFRDPRWFGKEWFREDCGIEGEPDGVSSVDVYFCHQAAKMGYRFGVCCDLKVGHREPGTGVVY